MTDEVKHVLPIGLEDERLQQKTDELSEAALKNVVVYAQNVVVYDGTVLPSSRI